MVVYLDRDDSLSTVGTIMGLPPVHFKTHGMTLELHIGDQICYVNPYEEYNDRRPENADLIISFLAPGITDLHSKSASRGLLGGIECYAKDGTQILMDTRLRNQLKSMTGEVELAGKILGKGKPIDGHLLEWGELVVGISELQENDETFAVRITIDDVDIDYMPLLSSNIDPILEYESTCIALVLTDIWKPDLDVMTKLISANKSQIYYIGADTFRKKDLDTLKSRLLPNIAEKVVCKKSKWTLPES